MLAPSEQVKIRVVVPVSHVSHVQITLGNAGAGRIGNYSHCSFSYHVSGQFLAEEGANPAIGTIGTLEHVDEVLVEAVCSKYIVEEVYQALLAVHPYEEPAIDIIPLLEVK